jgi:hypothetical protein
MRGPTHNESLYLFICIISIHIFYLIKFFDQVFLFACKNKQTNKVFLFPYFNRKKEEASSFNSFIYLKII